MVFNLVPSSSVNAALNEDQKDKLDDISRLNTVLSESQQHLKEALVEAERAGKNSFLSNMSHEICTPMNAIISLDNIALKDPDLTTHTREQLEKIETSAHHPRHRHRHEQGLNFQNL